MCGAVTLLCLAYPITDGRLQELENFEFDFATADIFEERAKETQQVATRAVIEEQYETYILDKGKEMGTEITSANVSVRWSDDGYWYPVRAEINAPFESSEFTQTVSEDLGIPIGNIYWS